jgi:hypothetical protein
VSSAPPRWTAPALLALWLGMSVANTHSVARFRPGTVLTFTLALAGVTAVLVATRRDRIGAPPRLAVSAALLGCALSAEGVRYFSYLPLGIRALAAHLVAATAVACALLWALPRRRAHDAALWLAAGCLLGTSYLAIRYDPLPRIDVWYSLDQAAGGLLRGRNPYEQTWFGGPGVSDAFTYLPMTAVLLAPFQALLGDVRWGMTAALLLTGWLLTRLGSSGRPGGAGADRRGVALLLWLTPGQLVQTEQAWTEPLLLCLLVATLWAVHTGRSGAAVTVLAVALATKQHVAVLLPALALWRAFGLRRAAAAAAGAAVLCLPFLLWSPADFVRDTVVLLLTYPPLPLSPNLYLAAYHQGVLVPFWLTASVVLFSLVATALAVRRLQPGPGWLALAWAVLLLTVNLVNKQAFYNQFWLVASLLLVAVAVAPHRPADRGSHPRRGRSYCEEEATAHALVPGVLHPPGRGSLRGHPGR